MTNELATIGCVTRVLAAVNDECVRAMSLHEPINSLHEGYSVILEEVDELWEEVKLKRNLRNHNNIRTELIQIAAMAIRTAVDVGYTDLE